MYKRQVKPTVVPAVVLPQVTAVASHTRSLFAAAVVFVMVEVMPVDAVPHDEFVL